MATARLLRFTSSRMFPIPPKKPFHSPQKLLPSGRSPLPRSYGFVPSRVSWLSLIPSLSSSVSTASTNPSPSLSRAGGAPPELDELLEEVVDELLEVELDEVEEEDVLELLLEVDEDEVELLDVEELEDDETIGVGVGVGGRGMSTRTSVDS